MGLRQVERFQRLSLFFKWNSVALISVSALFRIFLRRHVDLVPQYRLFSLLCVRTSGRALAMDKENKLKHLEFIQGAINRFSTNSFLIKGWSVVLVAALFALAASDSVVTLVCLAFFPTFVFWGLDGYFLWQERKYRLLYDRVRSTRVGDIDFSMQASSNFENSTSPCDIREWFCATFSTTLLPFYGILLGSIAVVMVALMNQG